MLATLSIAFADQFTATAIQDAVSIIERRIRTTHPQVSRMFIEAQSLLAHRDAALLHRRGTVSDVAADAGE